jgi:hypothetical protein
MKVFAAVLAVTAVSLSLQAPAAAATLTGYISDMKCATSGAAKKTAAEWIQPAAFESCVKQCVKEGSEAVFVTEDNKILKFDAASKQKITEFLGKKVSVTGSMKDGNLSVDSVKVLKMN